MNQARSIERRSARSPTASIRKAAKCSRPTACTSARRPCARCTRRPRRWRSAERFERRKQQLPPKTGEPWTEDEDRKLLAAFDAGRGLPDLAAAHQRTQTGVRARLVKYGRLAA